MKRFIVKKVMPSRRPMRPARPIQRNVDNVVTLVAVANDNIEPTHETVEVQPNVTEEINPTETKKKNKKVKKTTEMDTSEKIKVAAEILNDTKDDEKASVKRVRQDKGLIERVESSKIILTEDNRELLID